MQITLSWTCRECGAENQTPTDTADYGLLARFDYFDGFTTTRVVDRAARQPLQCSHCNHVSGEVGLGYRYDGEHRPSHERGEL